LGFGGRIGFLGKLEVLLGLSLVVAKQLEESLRMVQYDRHHFPRYPKQSFMPLVRVTLKYESLLSFWSAAGGRLWRMTKDLVGNHPPLAEELVP
jgi:hypothetical protein